jgi:hypothetical protein
MQKKNSFACGKSVLSLSGKVNFSSCLRVGYAAAQYIELVEWSRDAVGRRVSVRRNRRHVPACYNSHPEA